MRSDKGLSWISWVACEGGAAVDLAPSPQVHTHTHTVLTHSNINSRLFAAHAEMHASANVVTHNTVDAKETPLGASASTTTWQSVLPYGHYGFAGQLGKGKLAGGAVTTWLYTAQSSVGCNHREAGMWSLPVCDFELQLWRLSPTHRPSTALSAARFPCPGGSGVPHLCCALPASGLRSVSL